MKKLYEISAEYEAVMEKCTDETITEEELQAALAQLEGELTDKVSNGIAVIKTLETAAKGADAEIKRLSEFKKMLSANIDRVKGYYREHLTRANRQKVVTALGTMSVAKAGGLRRVEIDNEDAVPAEFKVIPKAVVNKEAVREALERGMTVAGAHLEPRGTYLRIS